VTAVFDWARSPSGQKMIRYSMVSVVSVIVSQIVLFICTYVFRMHAFWGNVIACAVATVPSYELNRKWAWGKSGKSHLWKEVFPFWSLAFIGLAFSSWLVIVAEHYSRSHHYGRLTHSLFINFATLFGFGVLWVVKFIIFNQLLFVHREETNELA
jgi:putative flippase GtrA